MRPKDRLSEYGDAIFLKKNKKAIHLHNLWLSVGPNEGDRPKQPRWNEMHGWMLGLIYMSSIVNTMKSL